MTATKIRPSSAPALMKCGAFTSPPFVESDAMTAGVTRHDAVEAYFKGDEGRVENLDTDNKMGVMWAIDYIKSVVTKGEEMRWEIPGKLDVEDDELGKFVFSGRWDMACGPDMFDLKWRLPSEGKSYFAQCAVYALMRLVSDEYNLDYVNFHVLYAEPGTAEVSVWRFDIEKCEEVIGELLESVSKKIAKPNAYCDWCALTATCPALVATVKGIDEQQQQMLATFDSLQLQEPNQLAMALRFSEMIKPWQSAIHALAVKRLEDGEQLGAGIMLKEKKTKRSINDINKALTVSGISKEAFIECCSVAIGKLETAFSAEHNFTSKAAAKRDLAQKLSDAGCVDGGDSTYNILSVKI